MVAEKKAGYDPYERFGVRRVARAVIKGDDIPLLLERFEEEFTAPTIHSKITIDTTDKTPEQVLDEFHRIAKPFLPADDLIRMLMNP